MTTSMFVIHFYKKKEREREGKINREKGKQKEGKMVKTTSVLTEHIKHYTVL